MSRRIAPFLGLALLAFFYTNCSGNGFIVETKSLESSSPAGFETTPPTPPPTPPTTTPPPPSSPQQALPAVSGTPLVKQIRNGQVIATYSSLGEAFTRVQAYRKYETGDIYELEPAIYLGEKHQAWIGALPKDYNEYLQGQSKWLIPTDITIRGITRNGYRPVIKLDSTGISYNTLNQGLIYIEGSKNITIENIDLDGTGYNSGAPKGAIYINGVQNLTLRNMRVMNFTQANGVFGTSNNSGTILFENIETGFNGGDSGPEHNYYMGSSDVDSSFTIIWRGCYSHDVYYGHTIKSRAQNNIVEGCYLKGKNVRGMATQGEAFLADFPNGGNVIFRNNILEKDYSGDGSNGIFIGYAMEGQKFPNASSVQITHNTFVARSLFFDSQNHELYPMNFYYPAQIPTSAGFPVSTQVKGNLYAGFMELKDYYSENQKYRGEDYKIISLSDLDSDFKMKAPLSAATVAAGQLTNAFKIGTKLRLKNTFGALD